MDFSSKTNFLRVCRSDSVKSILQLVFSKQNTSIFFPTIVRRRFLTEFTSCEWLGPSAVLKIRRFLLSPLDVVMYQD